MAITQGKGGKRQLLLIIVLVIIAVIVGVYLYSTRRPAPEAVPTERVAAPEAVVPGVAAPAARVRPEALSSERITKIISSLEKLDLVLHGELPIEVDPKEIGRANPFVAL